MANFAIKVIGLVGIASYAMAYCCVRMRHVSYHRFKVFAVAVDSLPAMPKGYAWRSLSPAELADHPIDVGQEEQARRYTAGLECVAVFDRGGTLAGITWLGQGIHHDPAINLRFGLPGAAAWDTGMWVPPDKRMGRAFSAMWAAIAEWLRQRGLTWSMSTIQDYNIASLLSHRRLGALELGTYAVLKVGAVHLTLGGWPLVRVSRVTKPPLVPLGLPTIS